MFDDPKGISNGSMDFDNPKVYGEASIFDGLVFCLVVFLPERWLLVEKVWVCPLVHRNVLQVNPYGILSMFVYKPPCTHVRHALERLSGKCTNLLECPPPIPVFVSRGTANTY